MVRKVIKDLIPPIILRSVTGLYYGWHGDYSSWREAVERSGGYDSKAILEKVKKAALKVKNGRATYERDSVLFDHIEYSFPLLSGLLWIAAKNNGKLNVMDFGGSLGSSYFQNKLFLDSLSSINWCIVEQSEFVKVGLESFENEKLHFFNSIDECLKSYEIDVVILSSVLQYLEKPFTILDHIKALRIKYMIIDRTPFIEGHDRITIQKVKPAIYNGSYPCWFFNKGKFVSRLSDEYKLVLEFDALDKANIKSKFKGFILEKVSAS